MTRTRLPNRRAHLLLVFEHDGQRYTAGIGVDAEGRLAEISLNGGRKGGTAVDVLARDATIAAIVLMQQGCPVSTLSHALTRDGCGSASGPLAAALDLLARERLTDEGEGGPHG